MLSLCSQVLSVLNPLSFSEIHFCTVLLDTALFLGLYSTTTTGGQGGLGGQPLLAAPGPAAPTLSAVPPLLSACRLCSCCYGLWRLPFSFS